MPSFKTVTNKLKKRMITVSVAESCTGGLLSSSFTEIPGISKIFEMGLVTYSNASKIKVLGINHKKLKKYGAVSNEIAAEMVSKLSNISKSKLCISTTGIAGPKGGSKNKPIGLVFIGLRLGKRTHIIKKNFKGERRQIQKKIVKFIFNHINSLI